jgi:hypothetical protein
MLDRHIAVTSTQSAIRIRFRYFLRGHLKINGTTSRIVVRLDRWAAMVLEEGFNGAIADIPGAKTSESLPDLMRRIAVYLTKDAKGLEADVLRKSLQETLFFALGTRQRRIGSALDGSVKVYLRRRARGLLRCFLRLHLFNIAWLETSEAFRAVARTQKLFVQDMDSVERLCQTIVDSALRSQKIRGRLDRPSATKLIKRMEQLINS